MPEAPLPNVFQIPDDGQYHDDLCDPMRRHIIIHPINPPEVLKVIGGGNSCRVGLLQDGTVLKYPLIDDGGKYIDTEDKILSVLGPHNRLVQYFGKNDKGLRFELAQEGSVKNYLAKMPASQVPLKLRLKWSRQAAEAVDFIHSKEVIHCDIHTNNLLLDSDLDIKLCDFQGICGDLDGEAMESVRSFLPRERTSLPTVATDLFALGSAIYEIVTGHEPYEELREAEVEERYMKRQFPDVDTVVAGEIIQRCWMVGYESAQQIEHDLLALPE
jgi:serine/threonine protein kinase